MAAPSSRTRTSPSSPYYVEYQSVPRLHTPKEENAMVERANREVMLHLRNILVDSNIINDWEDHLGAVMSIMNHQKHGQFFPSPVSILFGDVYATQRILAFQQTSTEDGYAP